MVWNLFGPCGWVVLDRSPHNLQTSHAAAGGSSREAVILETGKGCSAKAEALGGFFCQCCFGHKSRTQDQMGCSEPTPPEPHPVQTSAHPDVDTSLWASKPPHLNALPCTSPAFSLPGLGMEFIILKSKLRCPLTTLVNKPFNWDYREKWSKA